MATECKKRRRTEIVKIEHQPAKMTTFTKRRKGLFGKAEQLSQLTGARVGIVAFSPAGKPFTSGDLSVLDEFIGDAAASSTTAAPATSFEQGFDGFTDIVNWINKGVGSCSTVEEIESLLWEYERLQRMVAARLELLAHPVQPYYATSPDSVLWNAPSPSSIGPDEPHEPFMPSSVAPFHGFHINSVEGIGCHTAGSTDPSPCTEDSETEQWMQSLRIGDHTAGSKNPSPCMEDSEFEEWMHSLFRDGFDINSVERIGDHTAGSTNPSLCIEDAEFEEWMHSVFGDGFDINSVERIGDHTAGSTDPSPCIEDAEFEEWMHSVFRDGFDINSVEGIGDHIAGSANPSVCIEDAELEELMQFVFTDG